MTAKILFCFALLFSISFAYADGKICLSRENIYSEQQADTAARHARVCSPKAEAMLAEMSEGKV